jgi:hypothetical protein
VFLRRQRPGRARQPRPVPDPWDEHVAGKGPDRRVILATADQGYSRLHTGDRGLEQLPAAYAFLLTWGTVPPNYYGDEIGMRYLPGLPDREGSICYSEEGVSLRNFRSRRRSTPSDNSNPRSGTAAIRTEELPRLR